MISGVHTILYARDADAARAFLRDVVGFDGVDAGRGWMILALPPGELACHPADTGGTAELFLMTDDVEAERARLEAAGAVFTGPVSDEGWGLLTFVEVPGFGPLGLYQPRHPTAI